MATNCMNETEFLLDEINRKREEMITLANHTGFTSEETVKCSQELDVLLNLFREVEVERQRRCFFQLYTRRAFMLFYGAKLKLQRY